MLGGCRLAPSLLSCLLVLVSDIVRLPDKLSFALRENEVGMLEELIRIMREHPEFTSRIREFLRTLQGQPVSEEEET